MQLQSFILGKLWGSQDKQPILAMHGWQDNAASFDNIAPFIIKNIPVMAINLPGHGLSSWLPPGFMYNELIYFLLIKRIKKYFGWEKLKIMAHSLSDYDNILVRRKFPKGAAICYSFGLFQIPSYKYKNAYYFIWKCS